MNLHTVFSAGFGRADITPETPAPIGGYPATRVQDPLCAASVALLRKPAE